MSLPLLSARWMADALPSTLPAESRAPCLSCPMSVESAVGRPAAVAHFNPRTKCCTYLPNLRNFQVGGILSDAEPAMAHGQRTVRQRMAEGVAVTPLGLGWPASFDAAYSTDLDAHFGHNASWRCPHYIDRDGGLCGVWRHRNAICSTWFCRYERGDVGKRLWRAVESMLTLAEQALVWWVLDELELEAAAVERLQRPSDPACSLDGAVPITEVMRRAVWGRWFGQEEDFFIEAARRVEPLSWAQVLQIGGPRLQARHEALRLAMDDHDQTKLPPLLRLGQLQTAHEDPDRLWVYSYRAYDAVPMRREVLDALDALGLTTPDELTSALHEVGEPVSTETMRRWVDLAVLVPSFE